MNWDERDETGRKDDFVPATEGRKGRGVFRPRPFVPASGPGLSDDGSECADLATSYGWAWMDQTAIEAHVQALADRGFNETFPALMSNYGIEGIRRALGRRA